MLGLSFRAQKNGGKTRKVPLRKFGRHHSLPFLVVYSNETEAVHFQQLDHLKDRLLMRDGGNTGYTDFQDEDEEEAEFDDRGDNDLDNDNEISNDLDNAGFNQDFNVPSSSSTFASSAPSSSVTFEKDATSTEDAARSNSSSSNGDHFPAAKTSDPQIRFPPVLHHRGENILVDSNSPSERQRRSIFTNEIPEGPTDSKRYRFLPHPIPQSHPGILKARKESRIQLGASGFIPFPENHHVQRKRRRKHRRRKQRKRHGKRGKKLKLPKGWNDFSRDRLLSRESSDSEEQVCGRKKLVVNFADIGWGDWIISPKSFKAHYCAGACPFPLNKVSKRTC